MRIALDAKCTAKLHASILTTDKSGVFDFSRGLFMRLGCAITLHTLVIPARLSRMHGDDWRVIGTHCKFNRQHAHSVYFEWRIAPHWSYRKSTKISDVSSLLQPHQSDWLLPFAIDLKTSFGIHILSRTRLGKWQSINNKRCQVV